MKASEMICLLAKQIEMNGDRDVILFISKERLKSTYETEGKPLSVTGDADNQRIEIYGE